ncbi:hypothetical protein ES702_02861 [subsurface metagenome]
MKYDPELIKKEFRTSLLKTLKDKKNTNKNASQRIDESIYNFVADKVLKEIKAKDYKEIDDFIWRIFIDTINFVLHYGIIFREVLGEFRKEFKEDFKRELELNEEYTNLITEVFGLRRYKKLRMQKWRDKKDLDA